MAFITGNIMEDRRGKNTQLPLPDLPRQSIYFGVSNVPGRYLPFFAL